MLISNQEFYLQPNSGANKCEGRVITFLDTFNVLDVKKKEKEKKLISYALSQETTGNCASLKQESKLNSFI